MEKHLKIIKINVIYLTIVRAHSSFFHFKETLIESHIPQYYYAHILSISLSPSLYLSLSAHLLCRRFV